MAVSLLQWLETSFVTINLLSLSILFFLALITDIGIPVPFFLDTVLLLTAYKVLINPDHNWIPVILILIMLFIGRQAGSGILYFISRHLGHRFLKRVINKFPSLGDGLESLKTRLHHWAPLAVTSGRLTPGLLQITSIASGTIHLRYSYFAAGIAMASLIYDGLIVLLAFIAAHSPKAADMDFMFWVLIATIICVSILWPVIFVVIQRNKQKPEALEV